MANETIGDLRDVLFSTIRALRDKENPMDIDRARAVNEVAKTIVDSAKVEVDFIEAVGPKAGKSAFLEPPAAPKKDTLELQQEEEAAIVRGQNRLEHIPRSPVGSFP